MTPRLQIVGRWPLDGSRRVRAAAAHQKIRVHPCLITALRLAVAAPRRARAKTGA